MRHLSLERSFYPCLMTLMVVLAAACAANAAEYSLIVEAVDQAGTAVVAPPPAEAPPARRWRAVNLNPVIAGADQLAPGDTLTLELFPDVSYVAHVEKVKSRKNGTVTVRGRIEGEPFSHVLISTSEGRSLASIQIPQRDELYLIQGPQGATVHYLLDVDTDQEPPLAEDAVAAPPEEAMEVPPAPLLAAGPNDPASIDVMFVYTPAARQYASASGGIQNVISQAMQRSQLVLDSSITGVTLNLVHTAELAYTEVPEFSTNLSRITSTTDGYIDGVHAMRDQHGADLVVFLIDGTGGIAGTAWVLGSTSGTPTRGFSVSSVRYAASTYVPIHEMGHNMGCSHAKTQTTQPGPGLFSYSAGWRWTGTDGVRYCSVMSYEEGIYRTVSFFSNPTLLYKGVPAGNVVDADNARTIREVKHVVAGYRPSVHVAMAGDANNDGQVNALDLQILASSWNKLQGQVGFDTRADFNGDGKVNVLDLQTMAANWNK